jgi:hypothetical protein
MAAGASGRGPLSREAASTWREPGRRPYVPLPPYLQVLEPSGCLTGFRITWGLATRMPIPVLRTATGKRKASSPPMGPKPPSAAHSNLTTSPCSVYLDERIRRVRLHSVQVHDVIFLPLQEGHGHRATLAVSLSEEVEFRVRAQLVIRQATDTRVGAAPPAPAHRLI